MNLRNKKDLAAKTLHVGRNRIYFNNQGFKEIKEAITRQDIKDLYNEKMIQIKPIKGRKKIQKRKRRRGPGKIKKKLNKRKQEYVKITRKLRDYIKSLKNLGIISRETYLDLRKKIRMRIFKSKRNLQEYLQKTFKLDLKKQLPSKNLKKSVKTNSKKEKLPQNNLRKLNKTKKISKKINKSKNIKITSKNKLK